MWIGRGLFCTQFWALSQLWLHMVATNKCAFEKLSLLASRFSSAVDESDESSRTHHQPITALSPSRCNPHFIGSSFWRALDRDLMLAVCQRGSILSALDRGASAVCRRGRGSGWGGWRFGDYEFCLAWGGCGLQWLVGGERKWFWLTNQKREKMLFLKLTNHQAWIFNETIRALPEVAAYLLIGKKQRRGWLVENIVKYCSL